MTTEHPKHKLTDILLYLSVAIFLFGSGYKYAEWSIKSGSREQSNYSIFNTNKNPKSAENIDFQLFWDTWKQLDEKYIDKKKLDPQKMYYGAIKGMVASVEDPYTFFLTPDENKQSKNDLGGKFEGIGAQLGLKENRITVIAPIKDSPAEKAGVQAGDFVVKVDGQSTKKWTLTEAVSKIRGKSGTTVKLGLERNGKEREVAIVRQEIHIDSVELSYETRNGKTVAYLKLNQFGDTTNAEWQKAADEIAEKWNKKEIAGMVLDVRGNPGGYLESSVFIASEFIPKGKLIVKSESTVGDDREYVSMKNGKLLDIPLVVLINQGSASASEILSGALRDYKRATLVGIKSFGKGSVQEPIDLAGGAGLHVTIAKWLLPKGEWINGKGIQPDIEIDLQIVEGTTLTNENDQQLNKALETIVTK